jgi:hypothetical protein
MSISKLKCVFMIAGLGATLGACARSEPGIFTGPGGGGDTGTAGTIGQAGATVGPPMSTGVAGSGMTGIGPTACGPDGSPLPSPQGRGGGIPPQLPSTVTSAQTPVPALSGGTLLALSDGVTAVASDPDRDRVSIVDLATNTVRAQVALTAGDEPGRLAEDAAGRVHVALRRGGAVVTLDPATGRVSARRTVCSAPRGLAYQAGADLLHVACAGGELVSLPAAGGAATRTLTLERDLRDVVVRPGGQLLVSTFRRADVLVIGADGQPGQRLQPASGGAPSIFGGVRHVSPSVAWRMVALGDATGGVVMLHQTGVDDEVNPSAGGYAGIKGCSAIVEAGISVLTTDGQPPKMAVGMEEVSLAVDLALSPDGTQVAVAVPGNAHTAGMPTLAVGPLASITGSTANPCVFLGSPSVTPPTGQVVSVSYAKDGTLLAQTREPAALWRGDTGATVSLASDSREDTGHLLFHLNAGGGLACASCHPEGGEDGRVWNFACQGARRTQSIRGGIGPTAPFHWDGAEADFSHLMDDVFVGRMAGPPVSADQKQALQTWIDTIPALPVTAGLDASAVARGNALFGDAAVACGTCHAGTLLTSNATVDVGTGRAFQVPSLRGVSWRAPFMHDGCAPTLADRFGSCGGDKHGATSQLSASQLSDLTAYLQSL